MTATSLRSPPTIVVGRGGTEGVGAQARALDARRALVVTDPYLVKTGVATGCVDALHMADVAVVVVDEVQFDLTVENVEAGLAALHAFAADADRATQEELDRIPSLVKSPALKVNFDTGNAYLSGSGPHAWLENIIDRVSHIHAKDISRAVSGRYRGKVWGMLGCACGDGGIDWERIVATCRKAPRDIVRSIECVSAADAAKSLEYLRPIIERSAAR